MVAKLCQECDVIILEQNNALYSGKYDGGLSLGPWGQKVFDAHIPAPELLDRTIRTKWLSIFTLDHAEMERMQKEGGVPRDYTQPVAEEHRVVMTTWAAVYQTLLQDIDVDSEIDWKTASEGRPRLRVGAKVEDAQYKDGTWTITYRSTATNRVETEIADILVAADGAHSTIRRVTLSDVAPSYTGVVAWRGRVPDGVVVDRDREIRNDLLVWYRMLRSQYIILSVFCLQHFDICSDGYQICCANPWQHHW
jgi:2-polyprenyl-6-methoxyphenol hydroxylase-like FAD-dependent oxidoreductase